MRRPPSKADQKAGIPRDDRRRAGEPRADRRLDRKTRPMTTMLETNYQVEADCLVEIDDEDVWEMLPQFLANRRRDLGTLRLALETGDFPTAQRLGHNMKGAGAAYGLREITLLGAALESAAQLGVPTTALQLTEQLDNYLARVKLVPTFAAWES